MSGPLASAFRPPLPDEYEYFNDEGQSSTTSNGWVTKLEVTTDDKSGGDYIFAWSAEVGQSDKQKEVGMLVSHRPTGLTYVDVSDTRNGVSVDGEFAPRTGFVQITDHPGGALDLRIQFGQTDGGGTGFIRNVRIYIFKVDD